MRPPWEKPRIQDGPGWWAMEREFLRVVKSKRYPLRWKNMHYKGIICYPPADCLMTKKHEFHTFFMAEVIEASNARLRLHKRPRMNDDNKHSTGRLVVLVFVDMLHWLFQELETSESFVQLHILLLHIGRSLLFNQHHLHFFSSKNMEHHGTRWLFSENEVSKNDFWWFQW